MPSPVAHTLFGLTCVHLLRAGLPGAGPGAVIPTGLALLASLAPDLDFIPGIILGEPSRFHQTLSHSLGGSLALALGLGVAARIGFPDGRGWRRGVLLLLFILGHLFLDFFTQDGRPPAGFPLLWPFSDRLLTSPVPVFPYLIRDPALPGFWSHNLAALLLETLLLFPLWVVSRKLDLERIK
jgi:membrane-bound metal-dependent hydrolase YbcI (DUF457 family)